MVPETGRERRIPGARTREIIPRRPPAADRYARCSRGAQCAKNARDNSSRTSALSNPRAYGKFDGGGKEFSERFAIIALRSRDAINFIVVVPMRYTQNAYFRNSVFLSWRVKLVVF